MNSSWKVSRCLSCRQVAVQFVLLLWKNIVLQIRRPLSTLLEIITPITTVSVLLIVRFTVFALTENCFVTYDSDPLIIPQVDSYIIYYAPNTTEVNDLANNFIAPMLATSGGIMQGVATSEDIHSVISASNVSRERGCFLGGAGIYFNDLSGDNIQFSIRLRSSPTIVGTWLIDRVAAPLELAGPRHVPYFYLDEGFMHLQKIVSEAIIHYRTNQPVTVNVETRQIPSPSYVRDFLVFSLDPLLPLLIGISFVFSAGTFVKELVLEKESRTKEIMKIMGLSDWVLWTTWFLKEFVFLFVICFVLAIMLKYGIILPSSNLLLMILFFLLFVSSSIAFCFLLSAFFSSATLGILAGILTWSGLYSIHFFLNQFYDSIHYGWKILLSLLSSNICTGFGIQVISKLEQDGRGLTYDTFFTAVSFTDTTYNMGWVFLLLFIDTIVYMILYWYIEAVFPSQYGIRKPPYFFLLPSFWCDKKRQTGTNQQNEEIQMEVINQKDHETEPSQLPVGISIKNLSKIFHPKSKEARTVAVDNLSLKMYKGQITALLGHNGAGKTTTMNILTGFYSPTSGTAHINGLSIENSMDLIRHDLGLCPQHNVLFDRLTVEEHLWFFVKLKGVGGDVMDEIDEMIDDLELDDKADVQSRNLSGGMKRKLSVGIALIGGSKFVILDEPTSGMDPYARRVTWELLIKHKQDRTILLTTQFMDEADILGDRIAIMKSGKVKTSGSSLFLKKRYGTGYHLTIEKAEISTKSEDITALVENMVLGAKLLYDIGTEISLLLPDQQSHQFAELMSTLEAKRENLGVASFGVSVTTMEEVFIQVGRDNDEVLEKKIERKRSDLRLKMESKDNVLSSIDLGTVAEDTTETSKPNVEKTEEFNTGLTLTFQQFRAMLVKHFYYFTRFWLGIIFAIILPIGSVLLTLLILKFDSDTSNVSTTLNLALPALAEESNNIVFFWAQFGSNYSITFGSDNASSLQATDFFDFTADIEAIRSSVQNITDVNDCCSYQYQVLDKYCATRSVDELTTCATTNSNFGYRLCPNCLSCCEARSTKVPSCSDPSAESLYPHDTVFCPASPVLSLSDRTAGTPTGPIDDINMFVAERILQYITELNIGVFESTFQGGFVLHSDPVPAYSTCGCDNITETCEYLTPALLSSVANAPNVAFTSFDAFVNDFCSEFTSVEPDCQLLPSEAWNNEYSGTLGVCIDYSSCNAVNYSCQCSNASQCQFGRTSPNVATTVPTATVWYNHKAYHTAPVVLNSFYNLYLKSINSSLSLSVFNEPLSGSLENQISGLQSSTTGIHSITLAVTIGLGFSFLYASMVILLTKEKEDKSKHLQFVGGINSGSYWLASYVKDSIVNVFVLAVTMFLFGVIQVSGFTGGNLGAVFLLFFFCTWACHSIAYVCTFIFSNSLIGFILLFTLLAFPSTIMNAVLYTLTGTDQTDVSVTDNVHYISTIHPVYGLSSGLSTMFDNGVNVGICSQSVEASLLCEANNIRFTTDIFQLSLPGVGHILIVLAIEAVIASVLVIALEKGFFLKEMKGFFIQRRKSQDDDIAVVYVEDRDISDERSAVLEVKDYKDYPVVIDGLAKEYRSTTAQLFPCCNGNVKLAVNDISFIVNKGECFGLLGVNGAGKTTTFKMLTGDIPVTRGKAIVGGYNISSQLNSAQQHMGYCPQFDALIELMTGRELLTMFARLKGVKEKNIPGEVETEIKRLNLVEYADKRCGTYSGGNKRKLSTAIAFIGRPPIVFLDEPTTGMDPVTRRFVWNAITGIIKEGRSVVLTTHSMEECEALCTRLTIMVNGSLRAIGSVQHLKSRYSSGYLLQVKVCPNFVNNDELRESGRRLNRRSTRRASRRKSFTNKSRPTIATGTVEENLEIEDDLGGHEPVKRKRSIKRLTKRLTRAISPQYSQKLSDTVDADNVLKDATDKANSAILNLFPRATAIEQYLGSLTYELPSDDTRCYQVFDTIEKHKSRLQIADYSVSQPTLEKVFLGFAREQT